MHLSPDVLALLALGETPDEPVDRAHLESCAQCRTELAELSRAVRVGRSITEEDMLITPADRVWHGIRAELGLDESGPTSGAAVVSLADRQAANAAPPARTGRRWLVPLLAAVLALVVGVGLGIGLDRISGQRDTVIAEARLDPLPDWPGAEGTATVEEDSDGRRWLVVDVDAPAPNGASQVWLIDNDVVGMSSLGFLTDGRARLVIPDSIDLARFPVVDVSAEPANDADPRHSGDSIVRGKLDV
jgi:hypothetical protein